MRIANVLLAGLAATFGLSIASGQTTLFEGARLITGDGSAPVANSAFLVENNRITRVGKKGEIAKVPANGQDFLVNRALCARS